MFKWTAIIFKQADFEWGDEDSAKQSPQISKLKPK